MLWCSTAAGKETHKVFYVNSYHRGYQWSDDIEKGLLKALGAAIRVDGSIDSAGSDVDIRIFRMDTKLNTSEEFKRKAALSAKQIIDDWQPDVVVTSDDNAAQYLVAPYLRNTTTPVVFCGVNWDASVYGLPTPNSTGMIEVDPLTGTLEILRNYANGDRIGYIGADTTSNRKLLPYHKRMLSIRYADGKLISSFEEWKREYLRLQKSVDMLIWFNPIGIDGWDSQQAQAYILANTTIPTGNTGDHTRHLVLVGEVKIAEEQGWWAGKTALKILAGTPPADIPVTTNKQSRIYINMALAKKLGIKFPLDLIQRATFLEEENPR
jgi:hypothetical protein